MPWQYVNIQSPIDKMDVAAEVKLGWGELNSSGIQIQFLC